MYPLPIAEALDRLIYDARLRGSATLVDERIVIVDVDERSLSLHGRWPWSRTAAATLIDPITGKGGARVLGLAAPIAEGGPPATGERPLVEALQERPVVLGYYFSAHPGGVFTGRLPSPVMDASGLGPRRGRDLPWTGYNGNPPHLQEAAAGAGFYNPVVDADGVVRALPLLTTFDGQVYESLAVAVLRQYLGGGSLMLAEDRIVLRGDQGSLTLPLSGQHSVLLPFAGQVVPRPVEVRAGQVLVHDATRVDAVIADSATEGGARVEPPAAAGAGHVARFRYVSAADVLEGRVEPSVFRGRVVLLGSSAPGQGDLRATPTDFSLPGVELQATLLAAALDSLEGDSPLKRRGEALEFLGTMTVAVVGMALAFLLPITGAVGVVLMSALAALTLWIVAAIGWFNFGVVLPVAAGLLLATLLAVVNLASGYFIEGRARRAVAGLFGEYVSPDLVERMMRNPQRFQSAPSENRELTILFVDIRGFTRIAESLQPEPLREYINDFLTAMTEVVHRYGGTVDKYIGDAVMAFWGAPLHDPQHADHAVAAALSMLEEVNRLNLSYEARGLPPMSVGVGVNSGVVRVGDLGSRLRRTYTVIGDAVNLASRFQALTKQLDAPIIVGETTMKLALAHAFAELGDVEVAGRVAPVRVYVPAALSPALPAARASQAPRGQAAIPRESGSGVGHVGQSSNGNPAYALARPGL